MFTISGLSYCICFTFRMAQKISGLSDYKKRQKDLEILLCSARILQSEKLNFSLSVNMLRIDQVGTLFFNVFPSYDLTLFSCLYIYVKKLIL